MFSSSRFKRSAADTGDRKDEKEDEKSRKPGRGKMKLPEENAQEMSDEEEDEDDVFGSCCLPPMICSKPDAG
jgi:hypothetical protein